MAASGFFRTEYPAHYVNVCQSRKGMPTLEILDYKRRDKKSYEFGVLRSKPNVDTSTGEFTINSSWVDTKLATTWKDRCINHHGSPCRDSNQAVLIAPDWLIDTHDNCVVRGEISMEFVALSYRWGTSVGPGVNRDGLRELQNRGGLSSDFAARLPILRDAMHVVRSINERYLWIDAICIIHDDKDHLAHQLQHMGEIYASAKLTIIAADGDGMTGLPGLQGCSPPRELPNIFSWTKGREIWVRNLPDLGGGKHITSSEYFQRGWTFQEYTLSRRRLIFGNQQIHWACGCGTWHEDLPDTQARPEATQSSSSLRRWPNFGLLDRLLRAYNAMNMTYPEDALPGIAGLLELFSFSFDGGFLFGLPVMCFEAALLWNCQFFYKSFNDFEMEGVERRSRSSRAHSLLPDAELPSWSWIGWKGNNLSLLKEEEDYQVVQAVRSRGAVEKWITISTAQWYCHDLPASDTKYRICSSWHSVSREVPKGWVKEKYSAWRGHEKAEMRSLPFGVIGDFVYRHPKVPNNIYWRPFPVSPDSDPSAPCQMKQGKFLSCRTKRGWFRCLRAKGYSFDVSMDYHLKLIGEENHVCGWVQLWHSDAALPRLLRQASARLHDKSRDDTDTSSDTCSLTDKGSASEQEVVEIVIICERLRSKSYCWVEGKPKWFDKREYRHYYGVLCVEWDNGIAYRKGCGYIKKEVGEQYEFEDIDLILG